MRRARIAIGCVVAICFVLGVQKLLLLRLTNMPVVKVVQTRGTPDFICTNISVLQRQLKLVKLQAIKDPQTIADWHGTTNAILVWASTRDCKFVTRCFYDEWKNDKNFIGSTWYSSVSLFGETLTLAKIDGSGRVASVQKVHTDAVVMYAFGYLPPTNLTANASQSKR